MAKNLLIVESPSKAKTIEKILGKDFEVKSCFGHIRDLAKDKMGIDLENNYLPKYIVPDDKKKVVAELQKMSEKFDEIWLASDEDREGESISWHLAEVLSLDSKTTKRIVFHEITAPAIKHAIKNPRIIDMNLVNSQQARRVLDRLVGFELSPVLWKKIGMQGGLSAGRVQSVAVRLLVEKELEIRKFKVSSFFKTEAIFKSKDMQQKMISFKAEGKKINVDADARNFIEQCKNALFTVKDIQVKAGKRTPAAPFTTSSLQQEASRKLGYGVSKTMLLAQKLYENGDITYMRTDSVSLSETAMLSIQNQITSLYGSSYCQSRKYKNKNESAQEAHEAIRPTNMANQNTGNPDTQKLYDLIWKRTMASQMSDAQLEKTVVSIGISTNQEQLTASGEVIRFDGFLRVFQEDKEHDDDDDDNATEADQDNALLPPLTVGQQLDLVNMKAIERFTKPSARYTEASLVKKMEELGIGRPSTYAPTISTIVKRKYAEKRDKEGTARNYILYTLKDQVVSKTTEVENAGVERGKLCPTDLGEVVNNFLIEHFKNILDYGFTAQIENEFDEIAEGKKVWFKMIDDFYKPFHHSISYTTEHAERNVGERVLGIDPKTQKQVIARMGKYGPIVQLGSSSNDDKTEKPKYASLQPNQNIATISLGDALVLFNLPRTIGLYEDKDVIINIGRFGPYAQHDSKFYSLKKEMDPYAVELDEIVPLIDEKRKMKSEQTIKTFEKEKIFILRGPYGPYIKKGLKNYKLSKELQEHPEKITLEEALAIIEELTKNPPKKRRTFKKK
ncbi:MAG: type I DNA topoisomerase [Phycisphaerales bacterium]|nr:type I DNA topoisomerase [Phycisphaerales bacterium]